MEGIKGKKKKDQGTTLKKEKYLFSLASLFLQLIYSLILLLYFLTW